MVYRQIRKVGNRAGIVFHATYGFVPRWCIPNILGLIIIYKTWNCAIKLPSSPFSDTPTWKRVHLHFPPYSDMFYPIVCNEKNHNIITNVVHAQLFIKLTNIQYCWLKTPSNQPIMAEYAVDHPTNRKWVVTCYDFFSGLTCSLSH